MGFLPGAPGLPLVPAQAHCTVRNPIIPMNMPQQQHCHTDTERNAGQLLFMDSSLVELQQTVQE
jgi:hypothetical protein